jgi:hypothetical protein
MPSAWFAWFESRLPNGTARASASLLLPPTTLTKFIERIYTVDQTRTGPPARASFGNPALRRYGVVGAAVAGQCSLLAGKCLV